MTVGPVVDVRDAARILGVEPQAPWDDVRRAYRLAIATHHPDRTGDAGDQHAVRIIEAFRVLERARRDPRFAPPAPPPVTAHGPIAYHEGACCRAFSAHHRARDAPHER